ncbi:MAG: hypothetical protein QHH15_08040 [Candidatus Thermoplasmatota archaeon]|nr:hypothetical protein [Candidatus Thermoplasmatota archaeon]
MARIGKKNKKVVELFNEKTGDVVRVIRFHNSITFNDFLKDFEAMRYPNYNWRYKEKTRKISNLS